jgi:GNAT superfamily N-acetyltransferase
MSLWITPMRAEHLEDAAGLVAQRYRALRTQIPALPPRYAERDILVPKLQDILSAGPSVAAIEDDRLVGFVAGFPIDAFRGEPAVISPEWGNAAVLEESPRIYRALYARLAVEWLSDARTVHLVASLANDRLGLQEWHWLGFGLAAADAIRDLSPVAEPPDAVAIRRAGPADTGAVHRLESALAEHLTASPVFVAGVHPRSRAEVSALLADPAFALWLACRDGEPVAYLLSGPASENACTIIYDEGTTSITGAYTLPDARGAGIATALLSRALTWARDTGYVRCAVDFEPMNPQARLFWLRHFSPVSYVVERHIDRRLVRGGRGG